MAQSRPKKTENVGGINRLSLVLSIILALALVAVIVATTFASGQTDIFKQVEYGKELHNSQVLDVPDTDMTYLGTYQNRVLAFNAKGEQVWSQDISGSVGAMAYDSEKDWVVVGSQDRNVYVYAGATGEVVNTYTLKGKVYDLDYYQPTGQLLVSAGVNASKHTIHVLDLATGEEQLNVSLKNTARGARFSPDGQYIYYGDNRGRVTKIDLTGETIASTKSRNEVYSLSVVKDTGDVVLIDMGGNVFKYDENLESIFSVALVGDGRVVGASEDGKWIAAGTREGDIYLMDGDGNVHFTTRQEYDVSQVYFGEERSFVVTLSPNLYEFSTFKLDNIGLMSTIKDYGFWGTIAVAVLLAAALIVTFPKSRVLGKKFFVSLYRHRVAYLMLLPSLVLILIFNYYNVFQAFYYAFTDWSLNTRTMREVKFVGFDNFVKMINEGYFLLGVKNLVIMMVCSFLKLLTVPVLLAELVFAMRNSRGESSKRRYWFRLLLVVPMVVPGVVSTLMWKNIYDPNIGALNALLDAVGLSNLKHSWLGDPATALGSIIMMGFPFVNSFAFLVFYGGLINIPGELFEAAKVDGSNPMWNFIHIHLPLISPQLKMLIITTFIGAVQDYGGIYLLTAGGPGTTTYVPGLELYYAATKFGQYGYACAMGLVMFVVIMIGSLINMRMKTQELN